MRRSLPGGAGWVLTTLPSSLSVIVSSAAAWPGQAAANDQLLTQAQHVAFRLGGDAGVDGRVGRAVEHHRQLDVARLQVLAQALQVSAFAVAAIRQHHQAIDLAAGEGGPANGLGKQGRSLAGLVAERLAAEGGHGQIDLLAHG